MDPLRRLPPVLVLGSLLLHVGSAAAQASDGEEGSRATELQIEIALSRAGADHDVELVLDGSPLDGSVDEGFRTEVPPGRHELQVRIVRTDDGSEVPFERTLTLQVPSDQSAHLSFELRRSAPGSTDPLVLDVRARPETLLASEEPLTGDVPGGFGGAVDEGLGVPAIFPGSLVVPPALGDVPVEVLGEDVLGEMMEGEAMEAARGEIPIERIRDSLDRAEPRTDGTTEPEAGGTADETRAEARAVFGSTPLPSVAAASPPRSEPRSEPSAEEPSPESRIEPPDHPPAPLASPHGAPPNGVEGRAESSGAQARSGPPERLARRAERPQARQAGQRTSRLPSVEERLGALQRTGLQDVEEASRKPFKATLVMCAVVTAVLTLLWFRRREEREADLP